MPAQKRTLSFPSPFLPLFPSLSPRLPRKGKTSARRQGDVNERSARLHLRRKKTSHARRGISSILASGPLFPLFPSFLLTGTGQERCLTYAHPAAAHGETHAYERQFPTSPRRPPSLPSFLFPTLAGQPDEVTEGREMVKSECSTLDEPSCLLRPQLLDHCPLSRSYDRTSIFCPFFPPASYAFLP